MAKKTTIVAGLTLSGMVPHDEAEARYRKFWQELLEQAQTALAREELRVTHWEGRTRIPCPRTGHTTTTGA